MSIENPLILLTTDFSDQARRAYEPTLALARKLGGRILLAHVVEVAVVLPHGAPLAPAQLPPDASADLAGARQRVEEEATRLGGDVPVETVVELAGNAADGILRIARDRRADLLAMSTHGRTGLRRLVLGSVAETIVRRAPVPVLSFPAQSG
jgi:nucleotide-binding universal stress UspA family protein